MLMTYIIKYIKYFKSFLKESNIEGRIERERKKVKNVEQKKEKFYFDFLNNLILKD